MLRLQLAAWKGAIQAQLHVFVMRRFIERGNFPEVGKTHASFERDVVSVCLPTPHQ